MSEERNQYSEGLWSRTDTPHKWHRFMLHDWTNPSRYLAFYLVADHYWRKEQAFSLCEVGFGDAWDFRWGWKNMHDRGFIEYQGWEIMPKFVLYASVEFPEYDFREGGFMDLELDRYDITYTRHTFEHIHPMLWRRCLVRLLRATRQLCIITWYMPPCDHRLMAKNWTDEYWQNRYFVDDVLRIIEKMGFTLDRWEVGTNELWELRRAE